MAEGDVVRVAVGGAEVTLPARVLPLCPDGVVALTLGYGRTGPSVAAGVGTDVRPLAAPLGAAATVTPTGRRQQLPLGQRNARRDGYEVALDRDVASVSDAELADRRDDPPSAYAHPAEPQGSPQWGMTIDLDVCTGCGACVVACQAENNVPTVGPVQVALGRRMHWMRVDRYLAEVDGASHATFQPMLCQQCEHAPCEYVCPTWAAVHSPDGLNEQVYNRCIGTRFCANNCPYEARRFNWFHFSADVPPLQQLQLNPDVTVRDRGVMEKCTFCVQRIRTRDQDAPTSLVHTACERACPTAAITFGDLTDPDAAVTRRRTDRRAYRELEELGTRPRVSYLAVRGPGEPA
ncbi:MAG: 4Fe-4S dicluster domain-containing protein [Myxococcota bacterium]